MWEVCDNPHTHETILPQGIIEMVFNLSDPVKGTLPHSTIAVATPDYFIQGFNTHVVNVNYTGKHHLFGIRLQPFMIKNLLGIQASEIKDTLIDLSLLQPHFKSLWEQLNAVKTFKERVQIVETNFPLLTNTPCDRTAHLCNLFMNDSIESFNSVDTISQAVCYSSRQLNRKAQMLFGLPAEELISYKKFRIATQLMHATTAPLTGIAYEAGFYDQAHFCRIFKNYTGITPKQYQLSKSGLPFHLFS
jgi:AraC-like DNA-binding protein